jgi:hypothetical protein
MFNSSRRAREQSLSYRAAATEAAEAGEKAWGPTIKKYGKQFLIGTGATMAFAYAFEKLNAKEAGEATEASSIPSTTSATPDSSNTATTANTANNQAYPGPSNPNYSTYPDPNYSTSPEPNYSASPEPGYSTSPNPTSQTQNGYQQRAVDRDLPADIFGEPHLESWFIDSLLMVSSLSPGLQKLDPPRIGE